MLFLQIVLSFTLLLKSVCSTSNEQTLEFQRQQEHQLDSDGQYNLQWILDDTTVTFNVTVKTLGWIGLGFSWYGTMFGADIALGWVSKDGTAHITVRLHTYHRPSD